MLSLVFERALEWSGEMNEYEPQPLIYARLVR